MPTLQRVVNKHNPVNWAAPLNRGLLSWHVILPTEYRAIKWTDLTHGLRGTLTALRAQSAVGGYGGTRRPGGWGEMRFDGSATYLTVTNPDTKFNLVNWTLSIWAAVRALPGAGGLQLLIARRDLAANLINYAFGLDNGNLSAGVGWVAWYDIAPTPIIKYTVTPNLMQWYHVVTTYDDTAKIGGMYVDGVQRASLTGITTTPTTLADAGDLQIGRDPTGSVSGTWNGLLDNVRIYKRALPPREVWQLYVAGRLGHPQEFAWEVLPTIFPRGRPGAGADTTLDLSPAQNVWQTAEPQITQTLTVQPSQEEWQASAQTLTRTLLLTPAQEMWHPSSAPLQRTLLVTPAREAWAVQAGWDRIHAISPAQWRWQAQTETLTRTLLLTPSQWRWPVGQAALTQRLGILPAQWQWLSPPLTLTTLFHLAAGQWVWQAGTPGVTQQADLIPADNFALSFLEVPFLVVSGDQHQMGHAALLIALYDSSVPRLLLPTADVAIDRTSFGVRASFVGSQTGLLVINGYAGTALSGPNQTFSFANTASFQVLGAFHAQPTRQILTGLYTDSALAQRVLPATLQVDPVSFGVTVTLSAATSGTLILNAFTR